MPYRVFWQTETKILEEYIVSIFRVWCDEEGSKFMQKTGTRLHGVTCHVTLTLILSTTRTQVWVLSWPLRLWSMCTDFVSRLTSRMAGATWSSLFMRFNSAIWSSIHSPLFIIIIIIIIDYQHQHLELANWQSFISSKIRVRGSNPADGMDVRFFSWLCDV